MTPTTEPPILQAGLTRWAMPFDRIAGARAPQVPEDHGVIHAVRPTRSELALKEPYFIEDTGDYRAAICGARVKVIMPNSFKPSEEDACPDCIADAAHQLRIGISRPGSPTFVPIFGERWSPGRYRRLRAKRAK